MNPRQWASVPGSRVIWADAEEAKQNGGMVALFPRSDYAEMLAVPGGEPVEDLHCTLVYLGSDVTGTSDGGLGSALDEIVGSYSEISARIFAHSVFNPDAPGDGIDDSCGVYLLGNSPELDQIHDDVLEAAQVAYPIPEQHVPWIPHITTGYNMAPGTYVGDIVFDRIGLRFAGQDQDYPLLGVGVMAHRISQRQLFW